MPSYALIINHLAYVFLNTKMVEESLEAWNMNGIYYYTPQWHS